MDKNCHKTWLSQKLAVCYCNAKGLFISIISYAFFFYIVCLNSYLLVSNGRLPNQEKYFERSISSGPRATKDPRIHNR